jgi:hypothetical protein
MKTDNELIAEFMGSRVKLWDGVPRIKTAKHGLQSVWSELQYDKSWDWLMPVVEKIDGIYDYDRSMYNRVVELPVSTPINEVYKAVVQFITWYNENKKRYPL